jgi:hypothetical protein
MAVFPSTPEFFELKAQFDAISAEEKALYDDILSGTSSRPPRQMAEAMEEIQDRKMTVWNQMLELRLDRD